MNVLIKSKDITLLHCIGEGVYVSQIMHCYIYQLCFHAGEFGIVYKASLKTSDRRVAVKTLKGWHNKVVQTALSIHERRLYTIPISLDHSYSVSPSLSQNATTGTFDQIEVNKFVEESMKMSRFKHAHVMGLIGVCLDAGSAPYIIMPYMANGSLLKYLKKERTNIVVYEDIDDDEVRL